jgi:hypothetical protein
MAEGQSRWERQAPLLRRREAVVQAVEQVLREQFTHSAPHDDREWRRDAEQIADAALAALTREGPDG